MKNELLLSQGIDILCKNDAAAESLIAPRISEVINLLERYVKEIEAFNPAYGLVGTDDTNELIIKHILDSLAPVGIISKFLPRTTQTNMNGEEESVSIADAGSGAGLPGIPLAIVLSDCDFTLIERMGRRAGFLLNTKAVLSLANVNIEENELEKIAAKKSESFDLITFRAFKPFEPKLLKTLFKLRKPDGIIAAYKGKRSKIDEELGELGVNLGVRDERDASSTQLCEWEVVPYSVPFLEEERNLVVIK